MSQLKRIGVWGGSGFLGRYIVHKLAKQGHQIQVYGRRLGAMKHLKTYGAVGQITPIVANYLHFADIDRSAQTNDVLINAVGILYPSGSQTFHKIHAEAPNQLSKAAAFHGVEKLIHISAIGADIKSRSAYARSKGMGEKDVLQNFPTATILRPSLVFGPGDGFFTLFARLMNWSPVLPLIGGGKTRFQPVYVNDVAAAVEHAIGHDDAGIYELGGPRVYTFAQLLQLIAQATGHKPWLIKTPYWLAHVQAMFMELMPKPLLTRDQVRLLRKDNVVSADAKTLADLNISPTALEGILPTYLQAFAKDGEFHLPQSSV